MRNITSFNGEILHTPKILWKNRKGVDI